MATVYFMVFVIGLALTVIAFVSGVASHTLGFGGEAGDLAGGADAGVDAGHGHGHGGLHVPYVNFGTITAFMTWFGGVGYLLSAHSSLVAAATVALALAGGVGGAGLVFLFMAKVLAPDTVPMRASDYHLPGTLGRVSVSIPRGGTGEIVYTQGGSRKTAAARAPEGQAVERGAEVVVMRYERGIAYVRPWDQAGTDRP